MSSRLVKEGHEVVNFSLKGLRNKLSLDGIDLIIEKKGGYLSNYYEIYKFIKKSKPDVVLSNFSYVNPALLFGRLLGVKKNMVWFHSLNDQMEPTFRNIFIKKRFLKLADRVVANSSLTAEELHHIYKIPKHKIDTIAFWSNISESDAESDNLSYRTNSEVLKIGCPGRLVAHKNHKIVIEALAGIRRDYNFDFRLYIAGSGEERENLQKYSEKHHLEDQVNIMGHVSAKDMSTFYKTMDVIVLPSLHEAFGLVFIEAISLGTPVIVSCQFGALSFIDSQVHDISNFTFDPKSATELKDKLMPYFKNEGLNSSFFSQLYIETFDEDIIFNAVLKSMTATN